MDQPPPHPLHEAVVSFGLGLAAYFARHAMSKDRYPWLILLGRFFAAGITAVFAGWAVEGMGVEKQNLRYALVGCLSYASPEVLFYVLALVRKKGDAIVK
jgi:hypothetical protein